MNIEERKARLVRMKQEAVKLERDLKELHWLIRDEEGYVHMLEQPVEQLTNRTA